MKTLISICFLLIWSGELFLCGQDHEWWNRKHDWDGCTSWSRYLIVSPSYMGPNALPVPEVHKGKPSGTLTLEAGAEGHYSKGDRTGNLFAGFYTPLFSPRAGLGLRYVPLELYSTDTLTRDLRRSREYDARGISFGDLYAGTFIHLVREDGRIPDIMLSLHLKTASGTRFEAARHTDAPGYYVDLSAGKSIRREGRLINLTRVYGMIGFYAFQTNLEKYMQNDAVLYGAGIELTAGRWQIDHQLGGYAGYLDNGDRPLVYRLDLRWDTPSAADLKIRFQHGLNDFPYTSLRVSGLFHFLQIK